MDGGKEIRTDTSFVRVAYGWWTCVCSCLLLSEGTDQARSVCFMTSYFLCLSFTAPDATVLTCSTTVHPLDCEAPEGSEHISPIYMFSLVFLINVC